MRRGYASRRSSESGIREEGSVGAGVHSLL